MGMLRSVIAGAAALALSAGVAATATVSIDYQYFGAGGSADIAGAKLARDTFIGTGKVIAENFEGFTACDGTNEATCDSGVINTSVGKFSSITPAAPGGSAVDPKDQIVVRKTGPNPFGRYDTDGGMNWLDSNDMEGILWEIPGATGLSQILRIAFLLTDVDDVGNIAFSIKASGSEITAITKPIPPGPLDGGKYPNAALHLVLMEFSTAVNDVTIKMIVGKGDGFGIDGIRVAAVPLPAAGFLLLGGLVGLAALRRRQRIAA